MRSQKDLTPDPPSQAGTEEKQNKSVYEINVMVYFKPDEMNENDVLF